jgi:hypothetical protein
MFFNILYYDQVKDAESVQSNTGMTLGPIHITLEQVLCLSQEGMNRKRWICIPGWHRYLRGVVIADSEFVVGATVSTHPTANV